MVRFDRVSLAYRKGEPLFSDFDYTFEAGEIHGIIGKSGCGKTSLLYLTAGLLSPGQGVVTIAGKPAAPGRRDMAIILQEFGLFPWKNCRENLALGLELRRTEKRETARLVEAMLNELDLSGMGDRFPGQLSGGERQRLAIGRALILEPELLLLDEPFSALDAMTRELLQDRLLSLQKERPRPLTVIHVTHSIEEAVFLSHRIHIMDGRGKLHSLENDPRGSSYRKSPAFFEQTVTVRGELERISR
ncbi:MAG: ATP-binding cassette domain-containing protein [Spirochaetales bacterium]|nr:ATP-binding cassette domain-containing protein [Spirochaetales bacterium]